MRKRRQSIAPKARMEKSMAIASALTRLGAYKSAHTIGAYWPTEEEVDTRPIIEAATAQSKTCYLPAINKTVWRRQPMLFRRYSPGSTALVRNRFGIEEPRGRPGSGEKGTALDLVVVPIVGFNKSCDRIGMGAGYYDRAFATNGAAGKGGLQRVALVGVAFDCQLAEFDPAPHDMPMDAVITESRQYFRQPAKRMRGEAP